MVLPSVKEGLIILKLARIIIILAASSFLIRFTIILIALVFSWEFRLEPLVISRIKGFIPSIIVLYIVWRPVIVD
tara:strand:+ start:1234 stop:1458 length:225 start_codon:yes stop_codon:yes gene_type:complete